MFAAILCSFSAGLWQAEAGAPPPQAQYAAQAPRAAQALQDFDFRGVTLEGGLLRAHLDQVREFYLRIPNDDLLKPFRARAGRPAPGATLEGWYGSDTFHIFGQVLSGLARLHAASGDPACKEKLEALVAEWGACIEPDGWFYASRTPNAPHYIYDKMVGGLLDAWLYCGDAEALGDLKRITEWAVKNLSRERPIADTGAEWYTLSENLYRAWLATGDTAYRDFAAVWEYPQYWNLYRDGQDLFSLKPAYHAYSHVNTLGGLGAKWLASGDSGSLDTIVRAADALQAQHCYATGGFGPDEQLLPPPAFRERLYATHNSFETQCGCWAVFKLSGYLLRGTGDARHGDWVERLCVNGLAASIAPAPDGRVFYYSDYCPEGGAKANIGWQWTCCAGTMPMAAAQAADLVWLRAPDGLCVNLFTPASVHFEVDGQPVSVRQETRFPEQGSVLLRIATPAPVKFALRVRAPEWLAGPPEARVNDAPVPATADARHWLVFEREWHDGDVLRLELPMALRWIPLQQGRPWPAALALGPTVLAARAPSAAFAARLDPAHPEQDFEPLPGEPLCLRLRADAEVTARPFYAFREGEPYFLYLDPALARRVPHRAVRFSAGWNDAGRFRYGNVVGATAELSFEGTGIRWLGWRFDDGGCAEVRIDGQVVAVVDQYGPGRDLPFDWHWDGLAAGRHELRITLLERKPEGSKDRYLNVAGFEIDAADSAGEHDR